MILVVDDELAVRTVIKLALRRWGFDVTTASDGVEGMELFLQHRDSIRALVLDMTMPRLSGSQVFSRVREVDSDLPIVVISGYAKEDSIRSLSAMGRAAFLHKPFHPTVLMETLRSLLEEDAQI